MDKYIRIEKIGEGTYGVVYKGKNKKTGELVAIKKVRLEAEDEGIPSTTIRETSLLVELKHKNIVRMLEVQLDESRIYLIFEFLSMDLKKYLDCLPESEMLDPKLVQSYMYQMSNAVLFCHMRRIMHRDLKPQNILINSDGVLKVADFGLGRAYGVPVRAYTHEIVTLWYRAPEVLLGTTRYLCPVDIWSIGCIFAEMTTRKPLFQGDSEIDQLYRIFRILRTPNDNLWIGVSQLQDYKSTFPKWTEYKLPENVSNMSAIGIDLLEKTLIYDPSQRIIAKDILEHSYFNNLDLSIKPKIK